MTDRGLVLVVEDEKPISDLLRLYLTREGFGVHAEFDGVGGLTAARTRHPVAIVLDVGLPGMDGATSPGICGVRGQVMRVLVPGTWYCCR